MRLLKSVQEKGGNASFHMVESTGAIVKHRRFLDLFAQVTASVLYGWLVLRLWPNVTSVANWYPLLILPSEGLVVLFLLIRRPTHRISVNMWDWTIAAGGTFLILLIRRGGAPIFPQLGVFLMFMGLGIHLAAKLSLRRSFGLVAANRGVKLDGLYRFVRHPMYAGYIVAHIGFVLVSPSLWNVAVYAAAWTCLIARIFAEERVLSEDLAYLQYKTTVRYRLLPGIF